MSFDYIDYSAIPAHCQDSMKAYVETGRPVGGFLTAVLSNDFMEAFAAADEVNSRCIRQYALFLYNEAPPACYGSRKTVMAWIERGGLAGKPK